MELPKKIHFTCPNKNKIENPIWVECLNKYYELYDDYEIILYDDSDIYDIIGKHYPSFLEKIKKISVGAVLSDLFRYLILYLEGGIYSDLDCLPLKKIDPLLDETYRYFHGDEDRDNNLFIYERIESIVDNRWDFCGDVCDNSVVLDYDYDLGMKTLKCLGHSIDIKNTSTILSYEVHNDWHQVDKNLLKNKKICYKNLGIAQWFIMTEPKQEIFLKMFMSCMDNLDALVDIKQNTVNVNRDDYHYNVISKSGPLAFTKTVVDNMSDKIKILPSDFFCGGSWGKVPFTKNSYISHKFTSSWL